MATFPNISPSYQVNKISSPKDICRAPAGALQISPPEEPTSMKFICKRWEKTIPYPTYATIRATFEQVFEP